MKHQTEPESGSQSLPVAQADGDPGTTAEVVHGPNRMLSPAQQRELNAANDVWDHVVQHVPQTPSVPLTVEQRIANLEATVDELRKSVSDVKNLGEHTHNSVDLLQQWQGRQRVIVLKAIELLKSLTS